MAMTYGFMREKVVFIKHCKDKNAYTSTQILCSVASVIIAFLHTSKHLQGQLFLRDAMNH